MKPFNLQEALAGKPVVTRNGRKVTGFHVFPDAEYQRIYAVAEGQVISFSDTGLFWNNGMECDTDLFMASEKKEGWVNVYPPRYNGHTAFVSHAFPSLEKANQESSGTKDRLACVRIEWEE